MAPRWAAVVGVVFLAGVAAVAFADYELIRADAAAAREEAGNARIRCVYGSRPVSTAERKQRLARCARLPAPRHEAARVERRWDRRAPWYGLAAGASLLATAAMFVRARRRREVAATAGPGLSNVWAVATVGVSFAVGTTIWAALAYLVVDRWDHLVETTGGSTHDCELAGNDCGILGEFTEAHPMILLAVIVAGTGLPAAVAVWLLVRFFNSVGYRGPRQAERALPQH